MPINLGMNSFLRHFPCILSPSKTRVDEHDLQGRDFFCSDKTALKFEILTAIIIQWNPSIAATLGEQHLAFIEGLFCVHLRHGCLPLYHSWPLFRGGR